MPSAQWKKSPPELVARFSSALPDDARVEPRRMFGYPCGFVHGNMFCGLFQDRALVRVGAAAADALIASGSAQAFAPMPGRGAMRDYVLIPEGDAADEAKLRVWLARGLAYAAALPPKAAAKKTAATKPAATKPAAKKPAAKKPAAKKPAAKKPATRSSR